MIQVSEDITLIPIALKDQRQLLSLMHRIYPPAYAHYWKDDCSWYINSQYGIENLAKELNDRNSMYYFVRFRESVIGILKLIANCCYKPLPSFKAYKVHRIYLDTTVQGKGIGKQLMAFAETEARRGNYDILWLDAMDTHIQAQSFYKKLGFEKTERQLLDFPLLHDQHRPMWFMHKEL